MPCHSALIQTLQFRGTFSLLLVQNVLFNSVQNQAHTSTAFMVNSSDAAYLQQIVFVTFRDKQGNNILCMTAELRRSPVRTVTNATDSVTKMIQCTQISLTFHC